MPRKFVTAIDLLKNELQNARIQVLASAPGSPVEGQVYYDSTIDGFGVYTGSTWQYLGRLDQIAAPTADVALNNRKITGLADPSGAQDAATKAYVDNLSAGIAWKDSVRAATTVTGALATVYENGDTIDGVALVTGDRILIKNQSAGAENGIYVVQASGAPLRASDANIAAELAGAAAFVEEGTVNADSLWVLTTNPPITLESTTLTFAKFGQIGAAALTKFSIDVGDGAATSIVVTHGLGSKDVSVALYRVGSPFDEVEADVQHTSTTTITLLFAVAPTSAEYRCVVTG